MISNEIPPILVSIWNAVTPSVVPVLKSSTEMVLDAECR
jgi:hypothetical protein